MYNKFQVISAKFNPRMHNRGQNDPDDATHIYCLKHIGNFLLNLLDFVSNLYPYKVITLFFCKLFFSNRKMHFL